MRALKHTAQCLGQADICIIDSGPPMTVLTDDLFGLDQRTNQFFHEKWIAVRLVNDQIPDVYRQAFFTQQMFASSGSV